MLLLLVCKQTFITSEILDDYDCPIGFELTNYTYKDDLICYRRKGPETFYDKFTDCSGNLFSFELYNDLNIPIRNNVSIWTDYKSQYPGGPLLDWSYTEYMGRMLYRNCKVYYEQYLESDKELWCVIANSGTNLTARRCDEKCYRYCFIKPLPKADIDEPLGDLLDFNSTFDSPIPTYLSVIFIDGLTWDQAQKLCAQRKRKLLSTGWIYTLLVSEFFQYLSFPFGIMWMGQTLKFVDENITVSNLHRNMHLDIRLFLKRVFSLASFLLPEKKSTLQSREKSDFQDCLKSKFLCL